MNSMQLTESAVGDENLRVDLEAEFRDSNIQEALDKLDHEVISLKPVKTRILYKPENERDDGQESIEILLQVMENNHDDLVVVLAGYKDKMEKFFQSNPGMRSRIAHHVTAGGCASPHVGGSR